jgi:hypothetical protein
MDSVNMTVNKAKEAEAIAMPKYPSGITVEKTLDYIKQWGKGNEKGE